MNPAWEQKQDGVWTWRAGDVTGRITTLGEWARWSVSGRAGARVMGGFVPFTNALAPERYALEAAARYAEMFLASEAEDDDAQLRARVARTRLKPLPDRYAVLGRLEGARVVANAVQWLQGAAAAAVMRRRGRLELIVALRETAGVSWYSGDLPRTPTG